MKILKSCHHHFFPTMFQSHRFIFNEAAENNPGGTETQISISQELYNELLECDNYKSFLPTLENNRIVPNKQVSLFLELAREAPKETACAIYWDFDRSSGTRAKELLSILKETAKNAVDETTRILFCGFSKKWFVADEIEAMALEIALDIMKQEPDEGTQIQIVDTVFLGIRNGLREKNVNIVLRILEEATKKSGKVVLKTQKVLENIASEYHSYFSEETKTAANTILDSINQAILNLCFKSLKYRIMELYKTLLNPQKDETY